MRTTVNAKTRRVETPDWCTPTPREYDKACSASVRLVGITKTGPVSFIRTRHRRDLTALPTSAGSSTRLKSTTRSTGPPRLRWRRLGQSTWRATRNFVSQRSCSGASRTSGTRQPLMTLSLRPELSEPLPTGGLIDTAGDLVFPPVIRHTDRHIVTSRHVFISLRSLGRGEAKVGRA
jgi:hypothetical protein